MRIPIQRNPNGQPPPSLASPISIRRNLNGQPPPNPVMRERRANAFSRTRFKRSPSDSAAARARRTSAPRGRRLKSQLPLSPASKIPIRRNPKGHSPSSLASQVSIRRNSNVQPPPSLVMREGRATAFSRRSFERSPSSSAATRARRTSTPRGRRLEGRPPGRRVTRRKRVQRMRRFGRSSAIANP